MRRLVMCIVFALSAKASAQAPPAAAPNPKLLATLQAWEQAMGQSKSFFSNCTAVKTNAATKTSSTYKGYVMCLKPGFAKTHIALQPSPGQTAAATEGVYEEYIITPNAVHEYTGDGMDRVTGKPKVQNYAFTQFAPGQRPNNVMLDFLSGTMTAAAALQRFDIVILREDSNYIYLNIQPLTVDDKRDFAAMQLALFQPTTPFGYIPAMVRLQKDKLGQQMEEWMFEKPFLNAPNNVVQQYTPKAIAANDPAWKITNRNSPIGAVLPLQPRR